MYTIRKTRKGIDMWAAKDIALDLGTSQISIFIKQKGLVLKEPSVVAYDVEKDSLFAVGEDAYKMIGRTPKNIQIIYPLRDGIISNFTLTCEMIHCFLHKVMQKSLIKPRIVVSVPTGISLLEKRSVLDAAESVGARVAYLIEEPLAAALGAGIDITRARGHMIVNIGGGICDSAIISLCGIVCSESIRIGGNSFNDAIIQYIKVRHHLIIGDATAEEIKLEIGNAYPQDTETQMNVRGQSILTGLPESISVSSVEIRNTFEELLHEIILSIHHVLEKTPPEIVSDIMQEGILLTGGTALLKGLDERLKQELSIPVSLCQNPTSCVIRGSGRCLRSFPMLEMLAINQTDDKNKKKRENTLGGNYE